MHKIQNFAKVNTTKDGLTDEIVFLAMQSPGSKYNLKLSERLVKPRTIYGRIQPENPDRKSTDKIKKSSDPDMGTYNMPESYRNTQLSGIEKNSFKMDKGKGATFTDIVQKNSKWVPGVGHYKEVEKAYPRLSTSPNSIRVRRH